MPNIFKSPYTIDASGTYVLKTGQTDSGMPSVRTLDFDCDTGSFSGTITVKGRPRRSSAPSRLINYEADTLNDAVSDGHFHSDDITDDSLIRIDDTGKEIELVVVCNSGSVIVTNRSESDA